MYILKQSTPFVADSYEGAVGTKSTLSSANFLKDLLDFSNEEKDNINEETIELLHPYLTLRTPKDEDFHESLHLHHCGSTSHFPRFG